MMNVDEAVRWGKTSCFVGAKVLAAEVERLRDELAAEKAASVVPVITLDCYTVNHEIHVACRSLQDCHKLSLWLRDRIKNTPFAT
jgi:hypothetical protein